MAGSTGKQQSAFTAGEIDPLMHERTELKYYSTGAARLENVEIAPQGGFRNRDGLRDIGAVAATAARIFPFNASDGTSHDIVFLPGAFEVWGASAKAADVTMAALTADMLAGMTVAQLLDTMLVFHEDLQTQRVKHYVITDTWGVDVAPFANVPNWDFGADINGDPYVNGVSAVWQIEFTGLTSGSTTFELEVAGQTTLAITYNSTMATLATLVENAIEALPNVAPGIAVANPSGTKLNITFSGAGNEGDGWAVTGRVINLASAAITAAQITAGVLPGEPVFSTARGWPQCGVFYQQRLLVGGFRSVPNAWAMSISADYYNFDTRLGGATGAQLFPMETPGGEKIEHMFDNRYPLIFTSAAEYWLAERALSADTPPNHVQASSHGAARGVPVVANEGAALWIHRNNSVLGEFRYTDNEGNFVAQDASLLAAHLVRGVVDQAQQPATVSDDGNHLVQVKSDGSALLATLIRDQEVTAFTRLTSGAGLFKAVARNGRNEVSMIVQRPDSRRLERLEDGLLLDEAMDIVNDPAATTLSGVDRFNGRECWVIADNDVFGPFVPTAGLITLSKAVSLATVGSWAPPVFQSLPPDRTVGPQIVNKRKARIYALTLSVRDTTSIAISTNGRTLQDIDLRKWGMDADVAELDAGYTGEIKVSGLFGWADEPYFTISQVRPGRLQVRSVTPHAKL